MNFGFDLFGVGLLLKVYIYIRKCRKQRVFQEDEQEPEEWMEKLHKTFRRSSIDSKICMRYRTNPGTSFALYSYRRNH